MLIQLNGEPHALDPKTSVADLIASLQLTERRLAVELNGEILPRSEYPHTTLNTNDCLEIVHAIGGGQSDANEQP